LSDDNNYRKLSTRDLEVQAARSDLDPDQLQSVIDELTRRITQDLLEDKRIPSGEPDSDLGTDLKGVMPPAEPAHADADQQSRTRPKRPPPASSTPVPPSPPPSNVHHWRAPWRGVLAGLLILGVTGGAIAAYFQSKRDDETVISDDEFSDDEFSDDEFSDDEFSDDPEPTNDAPEPTNDAPEPTNDAPTEEEFAGISGSGTVVWMIGGVTYTAQIEVNGDYGTAQVAYVAPDGYEYRVDEDLTLTHSAGDWFYVGSDPRWADTGESTGSAYLADSFRVVDYGGGDYWFDAVCASENCYEPI
jgi:hypothetical protein